MYATYSPDDNKLRLYSESRLSVEDYALVKEAGFKWAPKQQFFVAPMWTPGREDVLLQLCGEIEDEDKSLLERAEERSERFAEYSEKRGEEAQRARDYVSSIADNIPLGQPILVGHHSERHAMKDAERIENGMRKAINLWETSKYWQYRANASLRHAERKERPDVRYRRIKTLESEKRKIEKRIAEREKWLKLWTEKGLTHAVQIANVDFISACFPLDKYPRELPDSQYEGSMSLWSALNDGIITPAQAQEIALRVHGRESAREWDRRWLAHYDNRIAYEKAMLGESGGIVTDRIERDLEVGGMVLVRNEWLIIVRVTKKNGVPVSVTTNARYVRVRGVEEITDYRAPSDEQKAAAKAATKLPPMCNFPGEGCEEMTKSEWDRCCKDYKGSRIVKATDEHGAYRVRTHLGRGCTLREVYITDAKIVHPPKPTSTQEHAPLPIERVISEPRPIYVPEPKTEFDAMKESLKAGVQTVTSDQLFPTPSHVVERMIELANIQPCDMILEPSAGTGAIVERLTVPKDHVHCVEQNHGLVKILQQKGFHCIQDDFLQWTCTQQYDVILMNPPFANAQDIAHINRAISLLKPGGRIVAICANGPRQNEKLVPVFRNMRNYRMETLPSGTFSGTGVSALLLSGTV